MGELEARPASLPSSSGAAAGAKLNIGGAEPDGEAQFPGRVHSKVEFRREVKGERVRGKGREALREDVSLIVSAHESDAA